MMTKAVSKLLRVWSEKELVLTEWRDRFDASSWSVLNNAIVRHRDALLMSYRVIAPSGARWLAMCRLTENFELNRDSIVLTSESFGDAPEWHADSRMVVCDGRLFLSYSSRRARKSYDMFLVELDADTLTAKDTPRLLELEGPRQPVEKNWMPFEHDGELWFVYRANPHTTLRADLHTSGGVPCRPMHRVEWDDLPYTDRFGELRGGAPPVLHAGEFVSFVHSVHHVSRLRRLWILLTKQVGRLRYVGGVYAFDAQPPFAPRWMRRTPVIVPPPLVRRSPLRIDRRVDRSAYPCGALRDAAGWLISYGAHEEYCCIARIAADVVARDVLRAPEASK